MKTFSEDLLPLHRPSVWGSRFRLSRRGKTNQYSLLPLSAWILCLFWSIPKKRIKTKRMKLIFFFSKVVLPMFHEHLCVPLLCSAICFFETAKLATFYYGHLRWVLFEDKMARWRLHRGERFPSWPCLRIIIHSHQWEGGRGGWIPPAIVWFNV